MGSENAAVFPLPVCASPMMSLPSSAAGIASTWIPVGFLNPSWAHDLHSSGEMPREAKVRSETSTPLSGAGEGEREPEDDPEGEAERDGPASDDAGDDMVDDERYTR